MTSTLKEKLEEALSKLDDLEDRLEDVAEDWSEETEIAWVKTRLQLKALGQKLKSASKDLEPKTDELALQAHLATMDARDHWNQLSHTVDQFYRQISRHGQTQLDQARVQAYLAKMESRDFMETQGKALSEQYQQSKQTLEKSSLKAATELKEAFEGLIGGLPK